MTDMKAVVADGVLVQNPHKRTRAFLVAVENMIVGGYGDSVGEVHLRKEGGVRMKGIGVGLGT